MALSVEIIDFTRPVTNSKNLYISGIVTNDQNEAQITNALYEAFSPFGLLYEVLVFPVSKSQISRSTSKQNDDSAAYYAFVKFYSYHAAQRARVTLAKTLKLGSQFCKVCNAIRNKEVEVGVTLYLYKCQELANFYLGFSGWTSSVLRLERDTGDSTGVEKRMDEGQSLAGPLVRFFCVVELRFPRQGLSIQGIGAWEEAYCVQDPSSKATAVHKARKRSYQRAMEHAFSRVLLVVVTHKGKVKVTVEIDTTKSDELMTMMKSRVAEEQVLQVTELGEEFAAEGEEETCEDAIGVSRDMDDANLHILQELGEAT